jgi:hypothetical protein
MGNVLESYVDRTLEAPQLYHDNARLEGADGGLHLHYQDLRLLLDIGQFHALGRLFDRARNEMDFRQVDLNGDDLIASTVIDGSGYDPSLKIEKCQDVYHFHYRGFRFEFSEQGFSEFLEAMKTFMSSFFPMALVKPTLIPLALIDPYDHIHKPSFAEWIESTDEYPTEHLVRDYARHLTTIRDIAQGILSGRQILPILVTQDQSNHALYIRRDGYCRYMAYKELGFQFIPTYVVSEEAVLQQPQHDRGPFVV